MAEDWGPSWDFTEVSYPALPKSFTAKKAAKKRKHKELFVTEEQLLKPVKLKGFAGSGSNFVAVAQPGTGDADEPTQRQKKKAKQQQPQQQPAAAETQAVTVQTPEPAAAKPLKKQKHAAAEQQQEVEQQQQQHVQSTQQQNGGPQSVTTKKSKNKFKQQQQQQQQDVGAGQAASRSMPLQVVKGGSPTAGSTQQAPLHQQQQLLAQPGKQKKPKQQQQQQSAQQPSVPQPEQKPQQQQHPQQQKQAQPEPAKPQGHGQQKQQQKQQQEGAAPGGRGGRGLLDKMRAKLAGGRFRQLNETLYTQPGEEAYSMMQQQPELFEQYHNGFKEQVANWPLQPQDAAISWVKGLPQGAVVADFGCGDARLAASVPQEVHSLDLVASARGVIACNMAHTPLAPASCDAAVFSLALMGTDYGDFLQEAARVLKDGGRLWIAEVRSRFATEGSKTDSVKDFVVCLKHLGFKLRQLDASNTMFVILVLDKVGPPRKDPAAVRWPELHACVYKKR